MEDRSSTSRAAPGTENWRRAVPDGFGWPDGYEAAACFTFDVDAESPILFDHPEAAAWLDVMSHQAYGPRTAVPRLLRLLDKAGVRATFFVPGYSAERWPDIARSIRDAGHGSRTMATSTKERTPRRTFRRRNGGCCAASRRWMRSSAYARSGIAARTGSSPTKRRACS